MAAPARIKLLLKLDFGGWFGVSRFATHSFRSRGRRQRRQVTSRRPPRMALVAALPHREVRKLLLLLLRPSATGSRTPDMQMKEDGGGRGRPQLAKEFCVCSSTFRSCVRRSSCRAKEGDRGAADGPSGAVSHSLAFVTRVLQ